MKTFVTFLKLTLCVLALSISTSNAFAARTGDAMAKKLYEALPGQPVLDGAGQMLVKSTPNIRCQVGKPDGMLGGWYVCEVKDGSFAGPEASLVFSTIDPNGCKNNSSTFRIDQQMMIKCQRSADTGQTKCDVETHSSGYEGSSRGFVCREY